MRAICFVLILWSQLLGAAQLTAVEVQQAQGKTWLLLAANGDVILNSFTLANPNRVVLDFKSTQLGFKLNPNLLTNYLIKHVRIGQPAPGTLRLVLETSAQVQIKTSPWHPAKPGSRGLRIDLMAAGFNRMNTTPAPHTPHQTPL